MLCVGVLCVKVCVVYVPFRCVCYVEVSVQCVSGI